MGTRLIEGRFLDDDDVDGRPRVVVVNQAFAKASLPGASPLGRHVRIPGGSALESWAAVVGVVADVRHSNVEDAARPLHELDPVLVVADVHLMGERISDAVALRRFQTALVTLFGLLSMALTAVGIAGLMAYSVRQRRCEIGVRLALGAGRRNVLSLILGEGLTITLMGALLGVAGSLAMSRVLKSMLCGVAPNDPFVLAEAFVVLMAVAAAAACLPSRRALRRDPLAWLRCQ
jgi:putative ABC transport system permease protein